MNSVGAIDEQSVEAGEAAVRPTDLTGELLAGKYRIIRPLGRGSTGTVYLCWHDALEKHVALKVLHPELSGNAGIVARFQREAQAAARLDHVHSVHVTDFGQDPTPGETHGLLYLAMEYIEGRDLGQILADDWPLSDQRIVSIMSQVLSALSAAHALGIVHRDLKPENILVRAATDETERSIDDVKVCDFGIAQLSALRLAGPPNTTITRLQAVTMQGRVVGTPAYMSPEQARAETQDARSDLYSAGVVLFQLLTRTLPFMAETPLSVAVMHCMTPPPPPSGYRPVNVALEAACLKALSKTREARFQTAREMQLALEAALLTKRAETRRSRRSRRSNAPALAALAPAAPQARSLSLLPTELVIGGPAAQAAKPQFPLLKSASIAIAIVALAALPGVLSRKTHLKPTQLTAAPSHVAPTAVELAATPTNTGLPMGTEARVLPTPPSAARVPAVVAVAAPVVAAVAQSPANAAHAVRALASAAPNKHPVTRRVVVEQPHLAKTETTVASLDQAYVADATTAAASTVIAPSTSTPSPSDAVTEVSAQPPLEASALPAPLSMLGAETHHAESPAVLSAKSVEAPTAQILTPVSVQPIAASPATAPTRSSAPPEHIDLAKASVLFGTPVTHHAGVSKASVRSAINESGITRCYRDALSHGSAPAHPVNGRLDIATSLGGQIVSATVDGPGLPSALRECVEQVARSGHVREADTGAMQASVTLSFQPD